MKKVLILFGGNSYEHEISCMSVNFIIKNINKKKFKFNVVGIDFNNNWHEINFNEKIDANWQNNFNKKIDNIIDYLKQFDIVFPIIHGNTGEDGKLQSLFELYNINYVGCDSYSSLICYDKLLTKLILEKNNISQIPYQIYNNHLNLNNIKFPVIIKPCKSGSSIGISVAKNKKELKKGINLAKKYDTNILIENYIENKRELECAILKTRNKHFVSNVGEIINDSWYDYKSKYINKSTTKISDINTNIKKEIKKTSKDIFKILNCKNLSRLDFIYDTKEEKLYFNEINTIPGFTEISMYPKLLLDLGIKPEKMITLLLEP